MKIRKKIISALLLSVFSVSAFASEFCDGFKQGYITGHKQSSGSSLKPLTPHCPLKPLKGLGDPKSDYEFGYTIGYRKGISEG